MKGGFLCPAQKTANTEFKITIKMHTHR